MWVRLAGVIILAGGASGGVLLAAPLLGTGLAIGGGVAVALFATLVGLARVLDVVLARRNEALALRLDASYRRDVLAARLAVWQLDGRPGTGRAIEATYWVER